MTCDAACLVGKVVAAIVNPLVLLLIAVAVAYFLWGLAMFLANAEETTERAEGKQKILWGIVGIFIMVSVFGIIRIVLTTFGIPIPAGI